MTHRHTGTQLCTRQRTTAKIVILPIIPSYDVELESSKVRGSKPYDRKQMLFENIKNLNPAIKCNVKCASI